MALLGESRSMNVQNNGQWWCECRNKALNPDVYEIVDTHIGPAHERCFNRGQTPMRDTGGSESDVTVCSIPGVLLLRIPEEIAAVACFSATSSSAHAHALSRRNTSSTRDRIWSTATECERTCLSRRGVSFPFRVLRRNNKFVH